MKKKVIIFDMDGVLFDTNEISQRNMQLRYPGLTEEMQREILCGNFHEEVAKITLPHIQETEEEKAARQLKFSKDKAESPLYPGIYDMLQKLHASGHVIVLNTSAYDRNTIPLMERQNIAQYFDFLATADVHTSKAEKFALIREKYGVSNDETVFVTDTLGDLREASIAGVPTIAVTYGVHDRSYFEREHHGVLTTVVDSVEELRKALDI